MLPYNAELAEPLYKDQKRDYDMMWKKYNQASSLSPTDSVVNYGIDSRDTNRWYRYTAYTDVHDDSYTYFFRQSTLDWISNQISNRLKGVHPEGKRIIVPDSTISSVLDSYRNKTFLTPEMIIEQVIMYIVNSVSTEFETIRQNQSLSAWVQKYDMDSGIRRFNGEKINDKNKTWFFNWNY